MSRVSWAQQSFTGGEFDDSIKARSDAERYKDGLDTELNFVTHAQGMAERRPGTKYVAPLKAYNSTVRLLPFEFSITQAYVIEMGPSYFRFFKDHAAITLTGTTITGLTKANPGVVTAVAHGLSNGHRVIITGVGGMVEVNNREFLVAGVTANTFQLTHAQTGANINTTAYTTFTSGGTVARIYELAHTYTTDEIPDVQYCQSADTMYLAHRNHAPAKLTRSAHTTWTLTDIDFQDGPWYSENDTATTLQPAAITAVGGSVNVTASAITGINNNTGFQTTDVGRQIRIAVAPGAGDLQFWGTITARVSTTVVTVTVKGKIASYNQAEKRWRLGVYQTGNYPGAVSFHESRLWWGGTTNDPQRIDGSFVSDFEDYRPLEITDEANGKATITDACACAFSLASNTVNRIHWLTTDVNGLVCGTPSSEFIVRANSQNEAISPFNVNAKEASISGSDNVRPVRVGNSQLFVGRGGRRVMELGFFTDADAFRDSNLTFLAKHIALSNITDLAFQKYPIPIVWAVNGNGELCGLTFERDESGIRAAWHRHQLGGVLTGSSYPKVKAVAVIPSPGGDEQECWLTVERTIGGSTVRYLEYVTPFDDELRAIEDIFLVDSGLTYDGSAVGSVSGMFHLEGETVKVMGDGIQQTSKVVSGGKVTLDTNASVVQLGYGYNSDLVTLKPDVGSEDGPALFKVQRMEEVEIYFHRTTGTVKVGRALDDTNPWSVGAVVTSGPDENVFNGDFSKQACVAIRVDEPTPCTILGIGAQVTTQGKG